MKISLASTFFFVLMISTAFAEVEVFSGGQHFKSVNEYRHVAKDIAAKEALSVVSPISKRDELRLEAVSFDKPIKLSVNNFKSLKSSSQLIEQLGVEDIQFALKDITRDDKRPILVISDAKKLKVLTLSENQT